VRDCVHGLGAQVLQIALEERKKGVPRVQHQLPALPRSRALRRLSGENDRDVDRYGVLEAPLLPRSRVPPGLLSLGPDPAPDTPSAESRRGRGGVHRRRPEPL
jgi:hypothetical protein